MEENKYHCTRDIWASEIMADTKIRDRLKKLQDDGFGKLPICVAKTQYSFSTDPNLKGRHKVIHCLLEKLDSQVVQNL